jgi:hypothetical protein
MGTEFRRGLPSAGDVLSWPIRRRFLPRQTNRNDPADLAIDDAGVDVGRTLGVGG